MTSGLRDAGVQINRHIERFGSLKYAPETLLIQEFSRREPIDESALEAVTAYGSFELFCRRIGIDRRQLSKTGKSIRMTADRVVQRVIGLSRERNRAFGIENLCARLHVRNNLHRDSGFIHVPDTAFAEIV